MGCGTRVPPGLVVHFYHWGRPEFALWPSEYALLDNTNDKTNAQQELKPSHPGESLSPQLAL